MNRFGSLRFVFGCFAAGMSAIAACSSDSETSSAFAPQGDAGAKSDASSFTDGGGTAADASTPIEANGIVFVHAASFPAFRVCLEGAPQKQPIPSADLLPESNLPGVEIGSVVRIDPLPMAPQRIWVFAVDDIKALYKPGKAGLSCGELVDTASNYAHQVAVISEDLSRGVHLLVLRGSLADKDLRMEQITLRAFNRNPAKLPVQVLPLSIDLSTRAGNRKIGVSAGLIADAGFDAAMDDAGASTPFVEGALPFGTVAPSMPFELSYDPADESAFATSGFFVTLGASLDAGVDAGPRQVILSQSLADIQRLSAPRALPGPWFSAASSYVLLLLGSAQPGDASADELSRLHFIAVPVAAPPTAGDAGEPPPEDAAAD